MKPLKKSVYYLFLILIVELSLRIGLSSIFQVPVFNPSNIIYHYYPELETLKDYHNHPESIDVLVLGGSVVTADTIIVEIKGESLAQTFCNIPHYLGNIAEEKGWQLRIFSLAVAGHNSLDSRYKYEYLKSSTFDVVFVYHGINDTRANNCATKDFHPAYRQIEFYDELFIFNRHKEINLTVIPFFIDYLWNRLLVKMGRKNYIPREHRAEWKGPEAQNDWEYGKLIKTKPTFQRNLKRMFELAKQKNEFLILPTYAHYLDPNYSLKSFRDRELDYDAQIFPAELYGLPISVNQGVEIHNEVIRELHLKHPGFGFFDFEVLAPPGKEFFDDICHLNENGCRLLSEYISQSISEAPKLTP